MDEPTWYITTDHIIRGGAMRIIGIYVYRMPVSIMKSLEKGWYPFGDYPEPVNGIIDRNVCRFDERNRYNDLLYRTDARLPEVNISCIVGKNGSCKSTLLDIFYRIINNFAWTFLKGKVDTSLTRAVSLKAALYFETDGHVGRIETSGNSVQFFYGLNTDGTPKAINLDNGELHPVLDKFFYTVVVNYSIYAFCPNDYRDKRNKNVNGNWLMHLFHKNDGYLTPIVLNPFRDEEGNINQQNENKLALQRLIGLILMAHFNKREFIDGYHPEVLKYEYDYIYLKEAIAKLKRDYAHTDLDISDLIKQFRRIYDEMYFQKASKITDNEKQRDTIIRYLAYKSVKICLTYSSFGDKIGIKGLKKKYDGRWTNSSDFRADVREVVKMMIEEKSHITLKLHQGINFIVKRKYDIKGGQKTMKQLFYKKPDSYLELAMNLPPSYFLTDLEMKKTKQKLAGDYMNAFDFEDSFYITGMSSGERQFLNSVSCMLYHLKNLESVVDDDHRHHYRHFTLIFDEVELYYHPEYQRRFVKMLLQSLSWCGFDREKIQSLNIIIVTHSPFILSDILAENTLYLRDGHRENVRLQNFGANFYDLLNNSFFFEKNAIGEISSDFIRGLINNLKTMDNDDDWKNMIGDPIIRGYLLNRMKGGNDNVQD